MGRFYVLIILILETSLCFGQKRVMDGEIVQENELNEWNFLVALFSRTDTVIK